MLLAPFVQRGGTNLVFPAQVVYARTRILLGQDRQALFFAEFALLHNHSFFGLNLTFFHFEWLREMGSVQPREPRPTVRFRLWSSHGEHCTTGNIHAGKS